MISKYFRLPKGRKLAEWTALRLALVLTAVGILAGCAGEASVSGIPQISSEWPSDFEIEEIDEPAFVDVPGRTNNAFNVVDFGEQGTGGWFYRYGDSKRPERSRRVSSFDGEKYYQSGANGLEMKKTFLHTSESASPMLEWRAAEDGDVNVVVTYVKSVNGDANPGYPDGVQLLVYKGSELLKLENVDISTEEETLAQIHIDGVSVKKGESLYFIVDPRANNAFDGGTLYAAVFDVNAEPPTSSEDLTRINNNANSVEDFGIQGSNGWEYMFGTSPEDAALVSHEKDGEYINATSPNLTISSGFIHPALNHNAILAWTPAVAGNIDLRVRYSKFEQHDGNPDFPDGVKVKVYKNDELLYEEHVDAPDEGENKIRTHVPRLYVTPEDKLYFMVDAEGNSSYDGGAFDITVFDVNGLGDESAVKVNTPETRQNWADVGVDFGPQGSNGFIFQWGYGDDPFNAYNAAPFDKGEDRYFNDDYFELKRDYVNPGPHDKSAIIKWRVAQNGTVNVLASYTKTKNEDSNPDWPDGTRVSIYLDGTLLRQETIVPEVDREVTKRLDVSGLKVKKGQYITMVINGLDNTAYDGGKYEFAIHSTSGLVGKTEKSVKPSGKRDNFASTKDDFGKQGNKGWYYQYGYYHNPFFAVNVERRDGDKYYTSDGVEIKKDYIMPGNKGKSANVKWIAAENGKINIDLEYTKLLNMDANPSFPDGVTVYLMKNGKVLRKEYFAPRTDKEVTKSLSIDGVSVKKGDAITMVVDPGKNNAYDGGKYMFVIEDANKTPKVTVGNNDNNTSLNDLDSTEQGTDGWWFLEGSSPSKAKVLTKKTPDGEGWNSRRAEGLEMKKDFVHTGDSQDPIYQFVCGETGKVDITGSYVKFGQEDPNPNWPDGITLKIYKNNTVLLSKKVKVKRGDGNDNVLDFSFDGLDVKRGDKLSFQICRDGNYAWDGGRLSVVIEDHVDVNLTPGNDNNTELGKLSSVDQGNDGWWFMEGTSIGNAKPLTKRDGDAWRSQKDDALEMKKDYVHPGSKMQPIYKWVVKDDGKVDLTGSYIKYGQNDANPSWPDGITLIISQNNKTILNKKVEVKQGDGNDNVLSFDFKELDVKAGDIFSFQIVPDSNNAWDAGRLNAKFKVSGSGDSGDDEEPEDPDRTNNAVLKDDFGKQGSNGWYYGTSDWEGADFAKLTYDQDNDRYYNDGKPELKADFVEPGQGLNAAYKWVVAQDGTIYVTGEYAKFANSEDENADGTTVRIRLNDDVVKWMGGQDSIQGNFSEERVVTFNEVYEVKKGDVLIFTVNPEGNDSYDGGRLAVTISDQAPAGDDEYAEVEPDPNRTNNTVLADAFGQHGTDGWYYGTSDWEGANFAKLPYKKDENRYYDGGKPELKANFVEPGNGKNAAYKWVVAQDGTINVKGEYTKFANSDDSGADGTTVRIRLNNDVVEWMGNTIQGNFSDDRTVSFDKTLEVKKDDILIFTVNPEGNDSYDGGRLTVTITDVTPAEPEEPSEDAYSEVTPDPNRTNETTLASSFGKHGTDGWYYGSSDYNGTGFAKLPYDKDNNRYYDNGKPELKADYVEPGNGRSAAYKWVVAEDGTINVKGDYTKYANSDDSGADGTCFRIYRNNEEKKWIGTNKNYSSDQKESFDVTFDVEKGDVILFVVSPENNDSYDGGRLNVTISDPSKKTQTGAFIEKPADPEDPEAAENSEGEPEDGESEEGEPGDGKSEDGKLEDGKPENGGNDVAAPASGDPAEGTPAADAPADPDGKSEDKPEGTPEKEPDSKPAEEPKAADPGKSDKSDKSDKASAPAAPAAPAAEHEDGE